MERDLFHQPYRKQLIPFYDDIENYAKARGAFGVALSGAGPTVLCFCEKGKGKALEYELETAFPDMTIKLLNIDDKGSNVYSLNKCI